MTDADADAERTCSDMDDESISDHVDHEGDPVVTSRRGFIIGSTVAIGAVTTGTSLWVTRSADEGQDTTVADGRERREESAARDEAEPTAPRGPADEPLRVIRSDEDTFTVDTQGEAPYADHVDLIGIGHDTHESFDLWDDEQVVVSGTEEHAREVVAEMDDTERENTHLVIPRSEGEDHPTFDIGGIHEIYDLRPGEGAEYWPNRSERLDPAEAEAAMAENPGDWEGMGDFFSDLVTSPGKAVKNLADSVSHAFTDSNTATAAAAGAAGVAAAGRDETAASTESTVDGGESTEVDHGEADEGESADGEIVDEENVEEVRERVAARREALDEDQSPDGQSM